MSNNATAERLEAFWLAYEQFLAEAVALRPTDFFGREPGAAPEDYARTVVGKLRKAVEYGRATFEDPKYAPDFGRINYRPSKSTAKAAKLVGVPFTRAGLNSLYAGIAERS